VGSPVVGAVVLVWSVVLVRSVCGGRSLNHHHRGGCGGSALAVEGLVGGDLVEGLLVVWE